MNKVSNDILCDRVQINETLSNQSRNNYTYFYIAFQLIRTNAYGAKTTANYSTVTDKLPLLWLADIQTALNSTLKDSHYSKPHIAIHITFWSKITKKEFDTFNNNQSETTLSLILMWNKTFLK